MEIGLNNHARGRGQMQRNPYYRHVPDFGHLCKCKSKNCKLPDCKKLKQELHHAETCKGSTNGICRGCRQVLVRSLHHSKLCFDANCHLLTPLDLQYHFRRFKHQYRMQPFITNSAKMQALCSSFDPSFWASNDSEIRAFQANQQMQATTYAAADDVVNDNLTDHPVDFLMVVQEQMQSKMQSLYL